MVAVDRPRQGRTLDDGDAGLAGQVADAQGHEIGALGHQLRGAHLRLLVFQRDGEMGGIGDDHIRLGDLFFQALHRALHGDLAAAIFHHRVAVHAAHLVFHFLLGHAQRALDAKPLVEIIEDRQHQQQDADAHADGVDHICAQREDLDVGELLHRDDLSEASGDGGPTDQSHQHDFQEI